MADAYARHLAALHGRFAAPDALIAAAARQVSPSPILERRRIVHGEANEVYRIAFESGLEVILRIARHAQGIFEKEAWAIGRCRDLGMAVPEVLSLQTLEADSERLEMCFLEMLPGERLSDSLSLPRETLRSVVREVGDQLSRMHAIESSDLGQDGRFFESDADDFAAVEAEFIALGVEAGLDRQALERALRFFEEAMREPQRRVLTHNDIRACHVLVHDGRLSGLIDFGQVSLDTPINEFAKWDYWEAPDLPMAWLREGYADKTLFDEAFDQRFQAWRLVNALSALRWYALTGYPEGVGRASSALDRYLAELGLR